MKARIWTVPNQITFLRLGFLPFFLILILYEKYQWALLVLFVSAATDGLDGLLARSLDQKSALGAYLDPIADKLLLSSSFIVLAMEKKIGWWLTILVISRDVLMLVVAAVILVIQGYRPFPPTLPGKPPHFLKSRWFSSLSSAPRIPTKASASSSITSPTRSAPSSSSPASTIASSSLAASTTLPETYRRVKRKGAGPGQPHCLESC